MNKVILIGNTGNEIQTRTFDNGNQVGEISLATSERWKDAQGNKQEKTTWHNLKAYGKTVSFLETYVKKGDKIAVEGSIQTETWEKDGKTNYKTVIKVDHIELISSKQ